MARFLLATIVSAGLVESVNAGISFIDPIAYRSAADSPFDMSGLGSTFFLEDFEDGVWDLPAGVTAGPYLILPPGEFTDSVDGDDGVIDGHGNNGHSMFPNFHGHNFLGPPTWVSGFEMNFDIPQLGFVPNAFGLVWTDGVPGSRLILRAYDETGSSIQARQYFAEMDPQHAGSTKHDIFVGLYSDVSIHSIDVTNAYSSWVPEYHFEVDHVQFGMVPVPEPRTLGILLTCLFLLGMGNRSRFSISTMVQRKELSDETSSHGEIRQTGGGYVDSQSSSLRHDGFVSLALWRGVCPQLWIIAV